MNNNKNIMRERKKEEKEEREGVLKDQMKII